MKESESRYKIYTFAKTKSKCIKDILGWGGVEGWGENADNCN